MNQNGLTETPNSQLLAFLFDKWQHHDDLMYRRWQGFWAGQTLIFGAVAVIFDLQKDYSLHVMGVLFILAALFAFPWYSMLRGDRRVRNTFNPQIVKILLADNLLQGHSAPWSFEDWSAEKDEHPVNLWHVPRPAYKGKGVRGSSVSENLIRIMGIVDGIAGLGLLIYSFYR